MILKGWLSKMTKHKHIGRKSLSILLSVLMVLTSMYAGLGVVASALYTGGATELPTSGTLSNGNVYKVTSSKTISGSTSANGLSVAANAKVVIYIASGVTLTVNGGSANGKTAGKAGIYLPTSSTLIFTGPGNLTVKGGSGANGGGGSNGTNASIGSSGKGGAGGNGGGGGGAGIGGNGGAGGNGGGGTSSSDTNGNGGSGGSAGGSCGYVNNLLTGSYAPSNGSNGSGGGGGSKGSSKTVWGRGWQGGGGGGGGGGGAAGAPIGAGGYGAGGGGGGAGGSISTSANTQGQGGKGGKGANNGSDGSGGSNKTGGSGGGKGSSGSGGGTNTTVKNDLEAILNVYTNESWSDSLQYLVDNVSKADLETRLANAKGANNIAYNAINSSSYSTAIKEHFSESGFITKYNNYIQYLQDAIPIKSVKESVDLLNTYIDPTPGEGVKTLDQYNEDEKVALRDALMAQYLKPNGLYDVAAMNSDLNKVHTAILAIREADPNGTILASMVPMGGDYAAFKLASCDVYDAMLTEAVAYANLKNVKIAVDTDIATYGDAVADPLNGEDVIAQAVLEALNNRMTTNYNTIVNAQNKRYFADVFPDGYQYVADFKATVVLMVDTRAAEKIYTENYYNYFASDKIFEAYSLWSNETLETRYDEDFAKNNALKAAYNADKAHLGEEIANAIYTMNFEGTNMLLQDAVDIYLGRLRQTMIERNDAQLAKIAEFAKDANGNFSTTITIDNFMGVKGAIGQYDADLYSYVYNKQWPISDPFGVAAQIPTLLANYNAYLENPNDIVQKHYHDGNGVFTTRYAGNDQVVGGHVVGYENDIARDGAGDNYIVNNANVQTVINKLEAFLKSNEIGYLFADFDKPLDQLLMKIVAEELFTDKIVNMLVGALYPTLCGVFEDLWANKLPRTYDAPVIGNVDISYADMRNTISNLGLALYPNQVAGKMGGTFTSAKNAMASKSNWNQLQDADGNLTLTWGLDTITADGYTSMREYYNAKASRFKAAVSDGLKALEPVLRALFAEYQYSASVEEIAKVSKTILFVPVTLTANLYANLTPLPGYSILIAPIFEALGITPKTQGEAKSQLTSTTAIVNAIIDPISTFVTGTLANNPVNTILNVLPNLMFGLSFDKVSDLLNKISTALNYEAKLKIIGQWEASVVNDSFPINLGDYVNPNELIQDADGNYIALTDVNGLVGYLLKSFLPDANLQLPVINGGKIIMAASMNTNASTRRVGGKRINFTADKQDEFYVILNWLVNALADEGFVENLLYALGGITPNDTIRALVSNIARDPNATLAALVELIDPQTYGFMDYDWYESAFNYTDIENLKQSDMPYLKYHNSWTQEKAQAIVDDVDGVLETVLAMSGAEGEEATVNGMLQKVINDLFNNKGITAFTKLLVTMGAAMEDKVTTDETTGVTTREANKVYDIVKRETGVDLQSWAKAFGYLFPDLFEGKNIEIKQPGETGYVNNTGVTASGEGENIVWSLNGTPLEDGNRAQFVDLFCAIGAGMAPIVKLIFTGEDLSGFEGLITIKGYDTYKNSLGMLFEAIDFGDFEEFADDYNVTFMSAEDYASFANTNGAVAAFDELAQELSSWIDFMLEGNTVKKLLTLLPNIVYFFESNGFAAALHNLLMPILVLLDVARPILDIDINAILSSLLTSLVNKEEIDGTAIVGMLFGQAAPAPAEGAKVVNIDINNLRFSDIIKLLDSIIGTDLYNSELVTYAIPAFCQARYAYDAPNGKTGYKVAVPAADSLTILLSGLIEALRHENEDGDSNKDLVADFIVELTKTEENPEGSTAIPDLYDKLYDLFHQEVTDLDDIRWAFMYENEDEIDLDETFSLPPQTAQLLSTYVSYSNDWTKELAAYIDENLDDIVKSALKAADKDENELTVLLTNLINGTVYNDNVINAIIALLVKLVSGLDEKLIDLLGVLLDIDIDTYYNYCDIERDEETGKVLNVTCTKEWGVTDKASFIEAFKTAVDPLKRLAAWLFLGDDYAFGTGTRKDEDGHWTYNDLLTLKGGEGYAYGLVPVLEALGAHPAKAETFKNADGTYNIDTAIDSFLGTLTDTLDGIIADPVNKLLELVPNLIYFLNSDGLKVSLNNLTKPLETLVAAIDPNVESLLGEVDGVALNDLTTPNILTLIENLTGLEFSEIEKGIICYFYLGKAEYFESANGKPAFRLAFNDTSAEAYNGDRADMITILVSLLLDMIKNNDGNAAKIDELLGTGNLVQQAMEAIGGLTVKYQDIDWNYYVPDDGAITEGDFTDTTGITYLDTYNDWTPETAKYVDDNLEDIVDSILNKFGKDKLDELLANVNLYNDGTVNAIMKTLSDALKGLDKIDDTLLNLVAKVLDIDFTAVLNYEEDTEYGVTDKESFLNALFGENGILTPFDTFFRYMLLGKDYAYLTSADEAGEDLITINGAQGYNRGLVPLMEALGVTPPTKTGYANATALLKDAVDAIFTRIDGILKGDNLIGDALSILPELFYFINADGLKVCAYNALAALFALVDTVNGIDGIDIDLSALTGLIDKLDIVGLAGIVEDATGIEIPAKLISFVENNRIGSIAAYDSINGVDGYKVDYTDSDRSELITCILSAALETMMHKDNASKIDALIGTDVISKVLAVLTRDANPEYGTFNWSYNEGLAKSKTYIGYPNNWTEDTAIYVDENIVEIGDMVAQAMKKTDGTAYSTLSEVLHDKAALYNDETVNKIAAALKELAGKINDALNNAVGAETAQLIYNIIGVDLTNVLAYTENTVYGVTDQASFIAAVKTVAAPFNNILSFLLLDEDYKYFVYAGAAEGKTAGDDILIINGAEGYKKGLVPLLEAIGCDVTTTDYDSADALLGDVLKLVCDKVDAILDNPAEELLAVLPNLIYFINADGLTVSVNNTIAAIASLYTDVLTAIGSEPDLDALLGFTLSDISFDTIFALVKDKTGIDLAEPIGDYLKTFNFGDTAAYDSKSGETAYKMTYNAEDERHDMLTIVASLLLEVLDERSNETALRNLVGNDAYQLIYNLLNTSEVEAPMNKIAWTHTDKADTGEVVEPLDTSIPFNPYGPLFTREKAQYIADHFQQFVDDMIQLLGVKLEGKNGEPAQFATSLEDLLKDVVGNSLYTKANLEKIYGYIDSALKKVDSLKGARHIKEVLKTSIGIDLSKYDGYAVAAITEGDRDAFTAEIIRMVQPLYPALKWLLADQDLAFFTDKADADQIVLLGAEGYKYGIVPVLEAVLCTEVNGKNASFSSAIMTQAEYNAAVAADDNALLTAILNPVFDKLDAVFADPANQMFALIPNLQYFINSNALDTCFKNILNAVYTLMNAIEPMTGKIDIMDVLGIKLNELTMSSIVNALVSNIGGDSGIKLDGMNIDKLLQCFNGYLYSYTNSKSGENPAYYMGYAGEAAKADTVAVILQMLLQWIAAGDNPAKLKQLVREKADLSEEGYKYTDSLIDIAATYCKTPSGTDTILHSLYYIFYGLYQGGRKTAGWLTDYNEKVNVIDESLRSSRDDNLVKVSKLLDFLYTEYVDEDGTTEQVYSEEGFASKGFVSLFQQIIEWIKTIFYKLTHLFKK